MLKIFKLLLAFIIFLNGEKGWAQLQVTNILTPQELAQKLVGDGVVISNVSFTGNPLMTGIFNNIGGTFIGIDSGIVLTTGRARSFPPAIGVNGNGVNPAQNVNANTSWNLPGDNDLALEIGSGNLHDACVLEFDFVPLGDTVRFNYVFSSEEYVPAYVCSFNDAFAFFISGPGIFGKKNIALVPGTTIPVSIFNVNNVPGGGCPNNPAYYIDNRANTFFTHDGHTRIFTALERVQPCETYHLKLVIADAGDPLFDSGVFLQAKSLTSNAIAMTNLTQTDNQGNSYLVEGCATGSFEVRRPRKDGVPLSVTLSYGGTAINGVDVQTLPSLVTIPPGDSLVVVDVIPIIDGIPEGIEVLKVFALAGCVSGTPTDSTVIQIRDYDTLAITPRRTEICRQSSIQINASAGFTTYQWDADPTLNNLNIRNPIATPINQTTTYICTAIEGTCHARDSAIIRMKDLEFISKKEVNCRGGSTGEIKLETGWEWLRPIEFSINGGAWQPDSNFINLPVGSYTIRIRDASGCLDSITINIDQAFPDLVITGTTIEPASCTGGADAIVNVTAAGGNNNYSYSTNGVNFQSSNQFILASGNYSITIRDGNGCLASQNILVPLNDTVTLQAGADTTICEGTTYILPATSNATTITWSPASTLSNPTILNPVASPSVTTVYYISAGTGLCIKNDSIRIAVRPAPVAQAGPDTLICYGETVQLNGSGGTTYQWLPSRHFITSSTIANPVVKPVDNISYSLIVKDIHGCQSLSPAIVNIAVTPEVKIFAGNDTVAATNQPLQLNVVELGNAGVTSFIWTPGNFLNDDLISSPVATLPYDMVYRVTASTVNGCQGWDDIKIKVYKGPDIYIPSAFSPNNDGLNDILKAFPVGIKEFRFFKIFNRWGQAIFSTKDPSRGWDGKIRGIVQPTGVYIWIAEAIDYTGKPIVKKGTVTIIR